MDTLSVVSRLADRILRRLLLHPPAALRSLHSRPSTGHQLSAAHREAPVPGWGLDQGRQGLLVAQFAHRLETRRVVTVSTARVCMRKIRLQTTDILICHRILISCVRHKDIYAPLYTLTNL